MSTHPMTPPLPSGQHLELPVEEQLARAKPWLPAEQMLLGDLTEEEEAAFLDAISR